MTNQLFRALSIDYGLFYGVPWFDSEQKRWLFIAYINQWQESYEIDECDGFIEYDYIDHDEPQYIDVRWKTLQIFINGEWVDYELPVEVKQ